MMFIPTVLVIAGAPLVAAHFKITYPTWRADSLSETKNYSQWSYPCGGVPDFVGNRTEWPIEGGAVALTLHHPWTYLWINIGLGDAVTNFNMSLTPELMNVSGRGDFCLHDMIVPMDIIDGTNASIQVVTSGGGDGGEGSALYNCADIVLRKGIQIPNGVCKNASTMSLTMLGDGWTQPLTANGTGNATTTVTSVVTVTATATAKSNSAVGGTVEGVAFALVMGLACVFAAIMGI
ncbi:uncharacterized protein GGS22DRAFT_192270 [Annulohypoxylon maeteangense]|uniref:uncharacterized protein n=1 Tax=Annulohypoxylon maeteangense TaxID=1927788 RepID=UPI0020083AFA|nr:uncharacterized protein GGS22DRAFT_192270 [Annulohypoxylon maeteangense]KAI0881634.1 hypothetical protein GGS22DRAFT_192270 [Annulohypoxylon maeteangense]